MLRYACPLILLFAAQQWVDEESSSLSGPAGPIKDRRTTPGQRSIGRSSEPVALQVADRMGMDAWMFLHLLSLVVAVGHLAKWATSRYVTPYSRCPTLEMGCGAFGDVELVSMETRRNALMEDADVAEKRLTEELDKNKALKQQYTNLDYELMKLRNGLPKLNHRVKVMSRSLWMQTAWVDNLSFQHDSLDTASRQFDHDLRRAKAESAKERVKLQTLQDDLRVCKQTVRARSKIETELQRVIENTQTVKAKLCEETNELVKLQGVLQVRTRLHERKQRARLVSS